MAGSASRTRLSAVLGLALAALPGIAWATPANRAALARHFGRFLEKRLDGCATCHRASGAPRLPQSLAEFPHNPFGARLAALAKAGGPAAIPERLRAIAREDSDGDGAPNEAELLLGHGPGDRQDRPSPAELRALEKRRAAFAAYLGSYRWQPFEPVRRPPVPQPRSPALRAWVRTPIDAFLAVEYERRGLRPRPEAPRHILLRRVCLDLLGLNPTPEEIRAFEADRSPDAYEKVVERLLADPRHGERWARHWMDIWRYSDWAGWTDGGQVRDSKPHIWRWRDWIVESLNRDKGYDRMLQEMLAADELAPEDPDALRATGFLVRNFKLLSREQWLEDTVGHTARAFLGVTLQCAKCHDHMRDPVSQADYYRFRAIFEPHNVRTDRIPGQPDTAKDGLVRAYDADPKAATWFYPRGDERNPDKTRPMEPGVPPLLGGRFTPAPVRLPRLAHLPDRRPFVIAESLQAAERAVEAAKQALEKAPETQAPRARLNLEAARLRLDALQAVLRAEDLEDAGRKETPEWKEAASRAMDLQRQAGSREAESAVLEARSAVAEAESKARAAAGSDGAEKAMADLKAAQGRLSDAEKALAAARDRLAGPPTTAYAPRSPNVFPAESTGRRLALARWLTDSANPLTARVAANHLWARHFGTGIVPTVDDFGRGGRAPSHPRLLDWLASELMRPTITGGRATKGARRGPGAEDQASTLRPPNPGAPAPAAPWSLKRMHRLIVLSAAYRMASTADKEGLKRDPDNVFLSRMPSRRLEAEVVRDCVLQAAGSLDATMGGPDIDHRDGLTSRRRSIYLRHAAEKQVEFLQIFDGPSVTECYERRQTVMPQQALALSNSALAIREARLLARNVTAVAGTDSRRFIEEAFLRTLARRPTARERKLCADFLAARTWAAMVPVSRGQAPRIEQVQRARENLALVLLNHNDFITVR